eukprot:snap_masked-scaffold_52-processed-gene-0.22-mRNA-1 protein AED:1.00 eAED:1.00 QI:0/-1/0/0/-1/1/1/0/74
MCLMLSNSSDELNFGKNFWPNPSYYYKNVGFYTWRAKPYLAQEINGCLEYSMVVREKSKIEHFRRVWSGGLELS